MRCGIDTETQCCQCAVFADIEPVKIVTDRFGRGAEYHYMNCEPRKALSYFFKSADLYNQLSNKLQTAKVYIHIGNCYYDINSNTDSVLYYNNLALRNYEEIKDTNGICLGSLVFIIVLFTFCDAKLHNKFDICKFFTLKNNFLLFSLAQFRKKQ